MKRKSKLFALGWAVASLMIIYGNASAQQPNVLFNSFDDLNDWVGGKQ